MLEMFVRLCLFMDDYKTIFIVCGICLFATMTSYVNKTSWGALITVFCWIATVIVCSVGTVNTVHLIKADFDRSNRQMVQEMRQSDVYKSIKTTNDLMKEATGVGIADMLKNPKESLEKTTDKTENFLDGLMSQLDDTSFGN